MSSPPEQASASFLSKVNLKKTQTKDSSSSKPTVVLCANSEQYNELMEETYLEKYFETIKDFTFKSVFVPLAPPQAQAIILAHKQAKEGRDDWRASKELHDLAISVDHAKAKLGCEHVFVRLSSRSPKDAALGSPLFKEIAEKKIAELKKLPTPEPFAPNTSANIALHALYHSSTASLAASRGEQAVELLVKSDRIQGDIEKFVEQAAKNPKEEFNVVVREFKIFDVMLEFRGFVYNGKLTALTQYNEYVYFPQLINHKEIIESTIKKFFEDVLLGIGGLKNFVVDFLLIDRNDDHSRYDNLSVYVVELNPFAEFAGSGLFTWTSDMDTLLGKKPFEFRVATQPIPDPEHALPEAWVPFLKLAAAQ